MSTQPPHETQPGPSFAPQGPDAYATPPGGGQPPVPPPGYGSGPGGGAPQPPKKKNWFARHKFLTAVLAVVALIVIVPAVSGGGEEGPTGASRPTQGQDAADQPAAADAAAEEDAAEPAAEPEAPAEAEPPAEAGAAGIGEPVRDGKFEFTVTGIEAGVAEIGNESFGEQAQGQFVLVQLTVTNIGDEPQTLFDDNQTLVDDQGREHSANTMAGIYLEDNDTFVNEINPGNTVDGTIVFDIPTDAVPVSIELHDSAFSGGVSVKLQ